MDDWPVIEIDFEAITAAEMAQVLGDGKSGAGRSRPMLVSYG